MSEKTASGTDASNEDATSSGMIEKELPVADSEKENVWDESKLRLIEYSLGSIRNDVFNMRNNDKYMQKEADDGGFGAIFDGFDAVSSIDNPLKEDIVGSGSEEEKFVIKGGLKTPHNGLKRIEKSINHANKDCDTASDSLESSNIFGWKKNRSGSFGNAWDSTVNFLKHPWSSVQSNSNQSLDKNMETNEVDSPDASELSKKQNEVVPRDSVNFTKNKTSSAWENTTNFGPNIANNVEMDPPVFDTIGGNYISSALKKQDMVTM
ncbi:uncharacterized protein LOC119070932 isoform X2 [Bradysia coprophila]|uniref:uncharacterized protein LOC119070932 isoform X2 n=1 Tax=Bradysia coprophila TaxID=38358 RepID=UPI00187DD216|nr:uncharacterized protein LOC119070932 isoform X2 [Bradysia coprophila]